MAPEIYHPVSSSFEKKTERAGQSRTSGDHGGMTCLPVSTDGLKSSSQSVRGQQKSGKSGRASSSNRMGSDMGPTSHTNYDDDGSQTDSQFTDESSPMDYFERKKRRHERAIRVMAAYLCIATSIFLTIVFWRMGLIFGGDETMSAGQNANNTQGSGEQGMVCNGLAQNCDRRADEIMYATVHNAMSSKEDGFLAFNNLLPLEDALLAGFRGLMLDSCDCTRIGIQLCHGLCIAGFRRPVATFTAIVDFMIQNHYEVVILELEINDESLGPLFDELQQVEGLLDLMYQHPGGDEKWPKLAEMIEMNKRLIVFAHNDVACESGDCPAGVHATYDFSFETPFDNKGESELMNVEKTCSVSRGWSNSDFVISNHFAYDDQGLPDVNVATVTNSAHNLQLRLDACQDKFSKDYGQDVINLLVVDFWNVGDVLEVVHKYNSALPAMTSTPSENTSPPLSAPSPTDAGGSPFDQGTTSTPKNSPLGAGLSLSEAVSSPSIAPTVTLESLSPSIIYDSQSLTIPMSSNPISNTLTPSMQESSTTGSFPSPSPTFGNQASDTSSPTSNTFAPFFQEFMATVSFPSSSPTLGNGASDTSAATFFNTPSPTFVFVDTEAENDAPPEPEKATPETTNPAQPQVEKENPYDIQNTEEWLASALGYTGEFSDPTLEDTLLPTGEMGEDSHHASISMIEKDPHVP